MTRSRALLQHPQRILSVDLRQLRARIGAVLVRVGTISDAVPVLAPRVLPVLLERARRIGRLLDGALRITEHLAQKLRRQRQPRGLRVTVVGNAFHSSLS